MAEKVVRGSGKGPSYYAHTTIYRFCSQDLRQKRPLTARALVPTSVRLSVRPTNRPSVCLSRFPWKVHVSLRRPPCTYSPLGRSYLAPLIKIRTSFPSQNALSFVSAPRGRQRGNRDGKAGAVGFRESHWRVVVQPRPLDVETSVSTAPVLSGLSLF